MPAVRELFENGNGIFYASPYSASPDSPRIYSHLGFIVIGWLWRITGVSMSWVHLAVQSVFGVTTAVLAVRTMRAALPGLRGLPWAVWMTLLGGGVAWLVALVQLGQQIAHDKFTASSLRDAVETYRDLFYFAHSGYGMWGANLFFNYALPNELIYHTLFFAAAMNGVSFSYSTHGGRIPLRTYCLARWLSDSILSRRYVASPRRSAAFHPDK